MPPIVKNRQSNAQDKALETISKVGTIEADPEEESLSQSATVVNHPANEVNEEREEKPKKKPQVIENNDSDFKKQPGEDFFEYVNRIPLEAFTSNGAGLYVYKQAQSGNVQLDKIYRPLTFDELKNIYAAKNGAGNYYVQFNTRDKKFSSMGQRYTFDGDNLALLGEGAGTVLGSSTLANPQQSATAEAIKIIAEASREANKANIELIKDHAKKPDEGSAITALIIKLMDVQRSEAIERADRDRKEAKERADKETLEAKEQAKRDIEAAKDRADRDNKFFQLLIDGNEKRANERAEMMKAMQEAQGKWFDTLLKEKDKKDDSLGMGNVLKELFSAFARERLEGGGEQTLPGWAGVMQTIVPRIAEAIPTILAARNGASPQQIQQIQEQQRIANETQHGPNGGLRQQNPAEPKLLTTEDELNGFIDRLGTYLTGKIQQGRPADPAYMIQVLDEEFLLVANLLENNTKEVIISAIQSAPLGGQLLQIPIAPAFLEELINKLKQPEEEEEQEPELVGVIPQAQSQPTTKKRKSAAH